MHFYSFPIYYFNPKFLCFIEETGISCKKFPPMATPSIAEGGVLSYTVLLPNSDQEGPSTRPGTGAYRSARNGAEK